VNSKIKDARSGDGSEDDDDEQEDDEEDEDADGTPARRNRLANIERNGVVSVVDGEGMLWVTSTVATRTVPFWLLGEPNFGSADAESEFLHTREKPFLLQFDANDTAQIALAPADKDTVRCGETLVIVVRTEDEFGNPTRGWSGTVFVQCEGQARGAGPVKIVDGAGQCEFRCNVAETIRLSVDVGNSGFRSAGVLRATFTHVDAVCAMLDLGDAPDKPHPTGAPLKVGILATPAPHIGECSYAFLSGVTRMSTANPCTSTSLSHSPPCAGSNPGVGPWTDMLASTLPFRFQSRRRQPPSLLLNVKYPIHAVDRYVNLLPSLALAQSQSKSWILMRQPSDLLPHSRCRQLCPFCALPLQVPIQVVDRYANVCESYNGEFALELSGGARPAGGAAPRFEVIGGRGFLPVLCTQSGTITLSLGPDSVLDNIARHAKGFANLLREKGLLTTANIQVRSLTVTQIHMSVVPQAPPTAGADGDNIGSAGSAAAAAADGSRPMTARPLHLTAGDVALVHIRALDAFGNLVVHGEEIHVSLQAEAIPEVDEHLSTGGTVPSQKVTLYELALRKGEATKTILFELAGEHSFRLIKPSNQHVDVTSMARVKVSARKATQIDVCNIPEAGRAGLEFELVVLARDRYGNVDHSYEQDVSLNHDGHLPPGHTLDIENGGVVKLRSGRGRVRATHGLPSHS
jgi:hypothetical protein